MIATKSVVHGLSRQSNLKYNDNRGPGMEKIITFKLRVGAWLPFGRSADKPSISATQSQTVPVYYAPLVYYSSADHVPESLQIAELRNWEAKLDAPRS
jgi:hypothetical protein